MLFATVVAFFLLCPSGAYAQTPETVRATSHDPWSEVEKTWGLRPLSISLTAGGFLLDFRYHVTNPDKAAPLFTSRVIPYLIHEATGQRYAVTETQKLGALRQIRKPLPGRNYYMIFGNAGRGVAKGDRVNVVIGSLELKDLVVR